MQAAHSFIFTLFISIAGLGSSLTLFLPISMPTGYCPSLIHPEPMQRRLVRPLHLYLHAWFCLLIYTRPGKLASKCFQQAEACVLTAC